MNNIIEITFPDGSYIQKRIPLDYQFLIDPLSQEELEQELAIIINKDLNNGYNREYDLYGKRYDLFDKDNRLLSSIVVCKDTIIKMWDISIWQKYLYEWLKIRKDIKYYLIYPPCKDRSKERLEISENDNLIDIHNKYIAEGNCPLFTNPIIVV